MAGDRNGGDQDMAENDVAAQAASARQYDWRPRPDPTLLTTQQLRETEAGILRTVQEKIDGLRELIEQRLGGSDQATLLLAERISKIDPELAAGRATLRTEFATADRNLQELIEARIDAIDGATKLLASNLDKSPSDIEKATIQLRELVFGRIDGIDTATRLLADQLVKFPTDIDRSATALREFVTAQIQLALAETQRVFDVTQEKFQKVEAQFVSNDKALTAALAAQEKAAAEQQKSNTLAIDKSEKTTQEQSKANQAQTQTSIESQATGFADLKERVVRLESLGVGTATAHSERRLDYGQVISVVAVLISIAAVLIIAFKH